MAQHDYNLANQSGADFRADLNNALSAIATVNSGATEPSTTFAHQLWVDTSSNVLKIRNAANNDWITTGVSITASNTFTGNITGNADTATTLATARTINGVSFDGSANISFDTDSVSEGSSNLYFTNERVDDQVNTLLQAGTGIQLTYDDTAGTLTIANTNDADITGVVAGNGLTGGGTAGTVTLNVAVDDSSIEIDSDALRVKALGITNAMLAGSIANAKLSNSSVTINSNALSLGGTLTLDTDDIGEGSSNLYYTQARFDSAFTAKSTSDLSEGTNLYYTDARARASISEDSTQLSYNSTTGVLSYTQGDTDTVSEGSSNLYYTQARFDSAFGNKDTDDLSEGTTNLYYTDTRANSAIDARVTKAFVDALNIQAASVDANSVALGTDTTGNYIQTITGTANKITVTGSGSESADVTLTLPDDVQVANNLTVAGNLTVNGTLTSLDTTNLDIEDNLFQLNAGLTGSPVNDSGMLINRGTADNGIFMWDESVDKFTLGLTTADGTSTGNITLSSLGTLVANIEGNVTGTIQTAAQPNITSLGTITGLTTTGDINFGDNDKAVFGAGSDLQIYHDGTSSYIVNTTNDLVIQDDTRIRLRTPSLLINNGADTENLLTATENGAVTLFYDNASKLATTSTGIDVTGTVVSDGLTVDNITIDGTEIDSNTDLTIDAAGDITLDADGGDFRFKDAGTTIATYSNVGGDWYITANSEDKDIVFQGNDGGSTVQALKLDMSDAGSAIFNSHVSLSDSKFLKLGNDADFIIYHDGTTNYVQAAKQDSDIILRGNDGGTGVNALTLDMSDAGTAIFNHDVKVGSGGKLMADTLNNRANSANIIYRTGSTTVVGNNVTALVVADAGNVGIGTTSPSQKLHVYGGSILVDNGSSAGTIYFHDTTNYINLSGDSLQFANNGAERARFDSSGRFGIGTTSAKTNLDVVRGGTTGLSAVNARTVALFQNNSSAGSVISVNAPNTGYSGIFLGDPENEAQGQIKMVHTDNTMQFTASGSTSAMTIDSSARVGIGTTSPNAELHVEDASGNCVVNIESATTGYSALNLGDTNNDDVGQIKYDNSNNSMQFTTNATERMRITSGGSVGIGTTSPRAILDLKNTGDGTLNTTASNYQILLEAPQGTGDYGRNIGWAVGSGTVNASINAVDAGASNATGLAFSTGAESGMAEAMRIDSSQRVGIGTTSPQDTLHVVTDSSTTNDTVDVVRIEATSSGTPAVGFGAVIDFRAERAGASSDSMGRVGFVADTMTASRIDGAYVVETAIDGTYSERMRISSTGNCGIGTTSPSSKLTLSDTSANSIVQTRFINDARNYALGVHGGLSDSFVLYDETAGATRLVVDTSGNVLINKTATGGNTAGMQILAGSFFSHVRDDGVVQVLNRKTSDGDILQFEKDNSAVGTIGAFAGRLYVGNDDTFLTFEGAADKIYPASSSGASRDNAIDLGGSSARFKDIHLRGSVYCDLVRGYDDTDTYINFAGSNVLAFNTGASERARIDSSGNLLVGGTSENAEGAFTIRPNTSNGSCLIQMNRASTTATSNAIVFYNGGTGVGSITYTNTGVSYNTSSDARLKDVTGEARGLEIINQLNPVTYNWKTDGKADEGLIAQEVLDVVPNAVSQNEDKYYQMDYSKLVTPLIKAVQELSNEVNELKQEIQNLKGE